MYNIDNDFSPKLNINCESGYILSASELADYLNIGKNRTYDLLNRGVIKGFRIDSSWRISIAAVNEYIKTASGL